MVSCGGVATMGISASALKRVRWHLELIFAKYGVFWRRRNGWRSDARHQFSQSLHMASRGIYWFHLPFGVDVATVGGARRLFSNFVSNVIPTIIYAN
jgi:hypothetical protein